MTNNQLAYEFAGIHVSGLSEQDRCCKCYRSDINSGPIQAGSTVVRVTDSGADIGANQFDLQTPARCTGYYNGF